jgi:hypothetical protein
MAGSQQIGGKPLILLRVNCRSILNKILVFWNLVDTCNPYVIKAQSHGLEWKLTILKYLWMIKQPSGDTGALGGGIFVCEKKYIECRELWVEEDFEMIAIEVKGRDIKCTWKIVGIHRDPNEVVRVLERLAA